MPTHEEMLRQALDPFQPLDRISDRPAARADELAPSLALGAVGPAEAAAQKQQQVLGERERISEAEAPAPHMLAEVAPQSEVAADSLKRLFEHYTEQDSDDEVAEVKAETPVDSTLNRQRPVVAKVEPGDVIQDGLEGDFVHDSAIVGADLDTHPHQASSADVDGWGDRRRRRALGSPWDAPPPPPRSQEPAGPATDKEST
jgi:hypothetical protein